MSKESKYKSKSTYFIIDRSFIRKFAYKLQNLFLCFFLCFFRFECFSYCRYGYCVMYSFQYSLTQS